MLGENEYICELSVISNITFLKIEISIEIAIDKRSFFPRWLINFPCHAIFMTEIWKRIWYAASDLSLELRWIIYLATEVFFIAKLRLSKLNLLRGTQSANFPRASPILCLVFAKVLALVYHNPHTYTEFVVAGFALPRRYLRVFCRQRAKALFWNSWGRMA